MNSIALLLLCQTAAFASADATGLYVMTQGGKNINPRVYQLPFVRGISIRTYWKQVSPAKTSYDWGYIDKNIRSAQRQGRKVMLRVLPGAFSPDWAKKSGGAAFTFKDQNPLHETFGMEQEMPVPWDEAYLSAWADFVAEMGKRYAANPAVVLVHLAGPTRFSAEMHLPKTPDDLRKWDELGYRKEKLVAAWKRCIDAFAAAFPRQTLALNAAIPIADDGVLEEVIAYGKAKLGDRFAVQGNWLCPEIPADQRKVYALMKSKKGSLRVGFQFIATASLYKQKRAADMSEADILKRGFDQGLAAGATYFEIYLKDLKDRDNRRLFEKYASVLEGRASDVVYP